MISKLLEGFGIRILPGILNVFVLLLIAQLLSTSAFGEYSLAVAFAGFFSSVVFGPFAVSIVAHHARLDASGKAEAYEASIFTSVLILACALVALSGLAFFFSAKAWLYILPAAALGFYTVLLEFPRARLKFFGYGLASMVQSVSFLGLTILLVQSPDKADLALIAFTLSYILAAVVSLSLGKLPRLASTDFALLLPTLRSGGAQTLSTVLENTLYLGMRFVVMVVGSPHALGVFSFCVDLAQRVVGIFANITTFIVVPVAFKKGVESNRDFRMILYKGGIFALVTCSLAVAAVFLVRDLGYVAVLNSGTFESLTFSIVSFAVVVNRIKKLIIDPIAMRSNRTLLLPLGFVVGTPISISSAVFFSPYGSLIFPIAYLSGYAVAIAVTSAAVYWSLRK